MDPIRVLVLDRELELLQAFSLALRAADHRVTTATNYHDALELLRRKGEPGYDLLVADLNLDLLRQVRNCGARLPVLMIAGPRTKATVAELLGEGAADYVDKTFRIADLHGPWVSEATFGGVILHGPDDTLAVIVAPACLVAGETPPDAEATGQHSPRILATGELVRGIVERTRSLQHDRQSLEPEPAEVRR